MNFSGQKRKFSPFKKSWRKEDSEVEDDSEEYDEEEDLSLKDLESLLKELLSECRKLSMQLQGLTPHNSKMLSME